MCLVSVSPEKPKSTGLGWKVVRRAWNPEMGEQDLYLYYPSIIGTPEAMRLNRWYDAARRTIGGYDDGPSYTSGFHIFLKRKDAEEYLKRYPDEVLVRVKYAGAHTQGQGEDGFAPGPQVIADRMLIIKEVKVKP